MEKTFISSSKSQYLVYGSSLSERQSRSPVYLSTYLARLLRSMARKLKSVVGWWANLVLSLFW